MAYHKKYGKKELNQNKSTQVSIIKGCSPYVCYDTETGEILEMSDYEPLIIKVIEYVRKKTIELVNARENELITMLNDPKCPKQAVGACQRYGIAADVSDLPKGVHQPYRVNRLIMHKTFTEYKSYHENEDPRKSAPHHPFKINLGAVDSQMAAIDYDEEHQTVALQWKCWDRDITFMFSYPSYVNDYNLNKFCLPSIQYDEETGKISWFLSIEEALEYKLASKSAHHKTIVAGYDLGRKKAFVLKVMTDTGKVIARREAPPRLRELNDKRERILENKRVLVGKLAAYDALGIRPKKYEVYVGEKRKLAAKAAALGREVALLMGSEIAGLCEWHGVHVVAGEDLSWVNDERGSSRWVHGECQDAIAHAVRRHGVRHFTVSAAYTSSTCPACGSRDTSVDTASRVVSCKKCSHEENRDSVGAHNVACRRARVELRARVRLLLDERSSCHDGLSSSDNRSVCWGPGWLAAGWGLDKAAGLPAWQSFLLSGNPALFWSSHPVFQSISPPDNKTSEL